jgi:hypothetical protein
LEQRYRGVTDEQPEEESHGFEVKMPTWFDWRSFLIGFVLGIIPGLAFLEIVVPII